ncbi:tyrosine-type recombinase/integrase [Pseudoroseicyclus aestuarii]|uniref:Site-specific recombinase XerD n=1 Tax=Pseudoroseicyclus aestuarii TaxID=1795041 RepID=A0A318T456_9RHOB|nr:integrase [Pseudoroseicyclus aestuarii]PYE81298.1 hypothetical protein DFP88_10789 [Pseudoroseicyclus aestuarii]
MPRRAKGPRLYWRARAGGASVWEIRDGTNRISTGSAERREAEEALAQYLDRKLRPVGPTRPEELKLAHALAIYAEEHAPHIAASDRVFYSMQALIPFWGELSASSVTGATCRRYAAQRGVSDGTIRRELGTLQAALNYCAREGVLVGGAPKVTLPAKPDGRERWLTRQEAAWLLRGARALNRDGRHLQDFILHGLYTGSRKATILAMHIDTPSISGGYVDTVNGILYRRPQGKRETAKRQRPARLPDRYLAHLRRQAANGRRYVVERRVERKGETVRGMVSDIRKGWERAVELAGELAAESGIRIDLSGITPHVLKHTAITWALQRGASTWDAAGYFSTSIATIERVYGHHSAQHMETAVQAMNRRS